ncbi:MAG: hypothetical protein NTZ68_02140 [Candidatus Dependentiae bacterium]|nr:hypothetical protein [Candidatus Dependentiae bacterium]
MKKIILLSSVVFFLYYAVFAQKDNQSLFSQANNHFMHGQFTLARESYEKIEDKSSAVWQNIGNCFFNEKKYANALVCWQRAQLNASWKQLGQLFSSEVLALKALRLQPNFWWQYEIKRMVMVIPKLAWHILLFLLLAYILLISSRYWYISSLVSHSHKATWFALFGIMICCMIWYGQARIFKKGRAVVVKEKVVVHAGPEKTFHIKNKLPMGSQVCVIGREQGMDNVVYKTELGKTECGWIVPDFIEIV